MNNKNLSLAWQVRNICVKYRMKYKIILNRELELEAYKNILKGKDFYYQLNAKIKTKEEVERLHYYFKYKKSPN